MKKATIAGAAAVAAPTLFNIRTAKAATTTWRIQTSWSGGIGVKIFKDWCDSIIEKTGKNTVVVASSDLSHYHSHVDAEALDGVLIENVRTLDPDGLYVEIQDGRTEACGIGGILTCMYMAQEFGMGKSAILSYTDSGEISGDRRKVVGYLSAALF